MMHCEYAFVPAGTVALSEVGQVYIDVGNAFCAGVLDHHHPSAPDACTAMLVLNHPEYVTSQITNGHLTIIPHEYPDLDAVTGAFFAKLHAEGEITTTIHHQWAEYVCNVDRGFTTLDPSQPVTPYSLFMMRMHLLQKRMPEDAHAASLIILEAGFDFLDAIFEWMENGGTLNQSEGLASLEQFAAETVAISEDLQKYQQDIKRSDVFTCQLAKKDIDGLQPVPGLWIEKPESAMFKSWARGDHEHSNDPEGFVFLAIQVSDNRFILSVDPSSDVYLKGLGDALERAEAAKRKELGLERQGENRPGYDSPDPWYDGRSPLHNYTIIDSPRAGAILSLRDVRNVTKQYCSKNHCK